MTDKTMREIAAIAHKAEREKWTFAELATAILAIPEIKEGQELLEKERAKSNRRKGITWRHAN